MKNLKPYQIKQRIFLKTEEFKDVLRNIFGDGINVLTGKDYLSNDHCIFNNGEPIPFETLAPALASYFDVGKIVRVDAHIEESALQCFTYFMGFILEFKDAEREAGKYREFLSLTDEEIRFIVNDIFAPSEIKNIVRNEEEQEITCEITTEWSDGEECFPITEELTLRVPTLGNCGLHIDFSLSAEDMLKWRRFCVAKGINEYLKNNPYLD